MYGKIFESMYNGTLVVNWKALITFQQMIILADDVGTIDMTPQALSSRTGIPLEHIEEGIKVLESDDIYSRSSTQNGRRIERIDSHRPWGWKIVNYLYYRNLATHEEKKKRDRDRISNKRNSKNNSLDECRKVSQSVDTCQDVSLHVASVADVAHTDTNTNTNTDTNTVITKKNTKKEKKTKKKKFVPPTINDVRKYCMQRNNNIDPEHFIDYQIARDWILSNGKKMACWMATIRNWEKNNYQVGGHRNAGPKKSAVDLVREANSLDEPKRAEEVIDITADVELIIDR